MGWLLNSIEPHIADSFLLQETAKEVWDSLKELYGERNTTARVYQLQQEISKCTRDDKPIHVYLSTLKGLWNELVQYSTYKQRLEEDKIFKVLASLGDDYEELRSQILMSNPLPSYNAIC
jgi:hypothetical protein